MAAPAPSRIPWITTGVAAALAAIVDAVGS
jgi:hypothetical protein